ncbi:MAG: hypothetical protein MUE60_16200, partial [Candidatus Eisenbacteria bacterium]|nr:hypothetical protein [Candidatus Eisenbacteria bacterium]
MIGLAGASLAAWAAALAPLFLGGPAKLTAAVWVTLVAAALLAATRDRARWTAAVFVALVCFPVVDYLSAPPRGFVGGAPGSLAFFPADVFLAAAAVLAAARGGMPSPGHSLRGLFTMGVLYVGVLCCSG